MIKSRKKARSAIYYIFMAIVCLIMIYPFIWSFTASFKPVQQLYTDNPMNLIPNPLTLDNYRRLFEVLPFGRFLVNSLAISIFIPIAMIFIASFTAYALTRLRFPGRSILFIAFIATMMIPSHVTLIPNYKLIVDLKLYNTYTALLLNNVFTAANAFNIFFFRQFFLTIPKELEDAAHIDGSGNMGIYFRIILPNAKPAIATTAILSFRNVWNSFLWPMLVLSDYEKLPLTVGLRYLKEGEPNWAVLLSGASLSIIPIVIIFLVFQKYFMAISVTAGFGGK